MAGATETYARWVHELRYEDIPENAVRNAKEQLLGILGATFAGAATEAGEAIIAAVREWGDRAESTVVSGGYRSSVRSAALVNSVSAQVLEYEDWVGVVHTGATVVPVALAAAEAVGASGKEMLTAQVAGNEIATRVGFATFGGRGGGNQHAVHQVEVPLVAGKLLGLDPRQLMDAVGGSCAQAQFPVVIGWTSHAKGYLTGMPAYTGIAAAQIAAHGFTGNREIVEHPKGYCFEAQGVLYPDQLTRGLGEKWHTQDSFTAKPYPMCGFTMAPADCVLHLVRENDIRAEDVEEVVIECPITFVITGTMWSAVDGMYERIRDGAGSGWSWIPLLFDGYYPIAAAIVDREVTPRQFRPERIFDARIQGLLAKIRLVHDPELDAALVAGRGFGARATVRTRQGGLYEKAVQEHRGGPGNPIDAAEKFRTATRDVLSTRRQDEIIGAVRALDGLRDVRELGALLAETG
ncbi:MAG TPA: MmgE/PrpD family protein [Dehalococcoidia bacterium]|nr:MmgE/PrpD family protein [Dehalococcoidia bacterium]